MKTGKSFWVKFSIVIGIVIVIGIAIYLYFPRVWGDLFYPLDYEEYIIKYSKEYNVDPALLSALIYTESHFNPEATSRVGARGLTQIMPATAVGIAQKLGDSSVGDLYDPETSIRYGAFYIGEKIEWYQNNVEAALAGYNGGGAAAERYLATRSLAGLPEETQGYVQKVTAVEEMYQKLYGNIFNAQNVTELLKVKQQEQQKTWLQKFIDSFKTR